MTDLWAVYEVEMKVVDRVLGNFPENPEALRWIVSREKKKEHITDEEASKLKQEMEETLAETIENTEEEEPVTGRCVFLKDENGIYLTERHIKGLLKECGRMLKLRGYREYTNHGVFIEAMEESLSGNPKRVYFTRNGEIIKRADGEVVKPIQVMTPRGGRASAKIMECINAPAVLKFRMKVISTVARSIYTKENVANIFTLAEEVGLLGDRSLGEGKVKIKWKKVA